MTATLPAAYPTPLEAACALALAGYVVLLGPARSDGYRPVRARRGATVVLVGPDGSARVITD